MQVDNRTLQTEVAKAISALGQSLGHTTGLSGAEIIEAMIYGLAMACGDMSKPENRALCINEAAKLLSSYATQVSVNSPISSLATH